MSAILTKGGNVSLTKTAPDSLSRLIVAGGWDPNGGLLAQVGRAVGLGHDYDLDLSATGVDARGKVPFGTDLMDWGYQQQWFVYSNHRSAPQRAVVLMNDNRTGKGKGDDETMQVDLTRVPMNIQRIVFGVVIWQAEQRQQKFGDIQNAYIRIYDAETKQEIARYDLGNEFSDETFVIFGELYRYGTEWKFRAIGQGYSEAAYRAEYGIDHPFGTEYARPGYNG
jgi:tellurium resistance protein TerD